MHVALLESQPTLGESLRTVVENLGHRCTTVRTLSHALTLVEKDPPHVAFVTLNGPRKESLHFLEKVQALNDPFPIIVLSPQPCLEDAVQAMQRGAQDFWVLPVDQERLRQTLLWLEERRKADGLGERAPSAAPGDEIVTRNPAMLNLKRIALKVAASNATVFIQGESGTGKELFARFIHRNSRRARGPFLAVNCAALPENLLESELFGYEKGAFTGANRQRKGKFELAHQGTLLLDEITEIPVHLQAKLLRVLQEGEIDRLGGRYPVPVDVRVLSTTNVDVAAAVREQRFRKDLYYRLNVIPLKIPPLRERLDDIPVLVDHFLHRFQKTLGASTVKVSPQTLKKLQSYPWPGNVRELENVLQRAVLLAEKPVLDPEDLEFDPVETHHNAPLPLMSLEEMERRMIQKALTKTDGNRTRAAEILGISVRTLRNKLHEYAKDFSDRT
ncbi:sigma-54-dependent transcriptional regulator [Desulfosoma caldarium]|uniref:Two-component system response regulator FlrC n=1 Tax=Desulfosoma caldarium TaxID=610254 RepID=A0A3N1VG99_9BACT|nr:sigma-54 dependent transcriptional regulator [Desulfosoma caldarium]ROR01866.1 two-component system response regulator FlrC [Desulfosoma caldarium]